MHKGKRRAKRKNECQWRIVIRQKRYEDEVRDDLARLPFKFGEYRAKDGSVEFYSYDCRLGKWLAENLYDGEEFGVRNKRIPSFIKNLDRKYLDVLFNRIVMGDGWRQTKTGKVALATVSKRLADDYQEIMLKLGMNASIRSRGGVYWVSQRRHRMKIGDIRKEWYRGWVASPTVPSHIVLVRRNGVVYWSGNCERQRLLPARKLLPTLISYAVVGRRFRIFGSGDKLMDMLYAPDFADLVIDLMESGRAKPVNEHIYDIGVGYGIRLEDLVKMVYEMVGDKPNYVVVEDVRKQSSNPYRVAKNDWVEILGRRRLRGFKEVGKQVIDEYLRRYEPEDFRLAVEVYEQRHRFGEVGV